LWYISSYEFARMTGSSLGLRNLCSYRFSLASQGACAQVRVKLVPEHLRIVEIEPKERFPQAALAIQEY
jgi:hypothetical protein